MIWFVLSIVLFGAAAFFALRHLTRGRLQVETVLGRMGGYGYVPDAHSADWRSLLRQVGRVAPGGHGASAEALRLKLAAAGWSKRLTPEDVAGLKVVLPLTAFFGMLLLAVVGAVSSTVGFAGGFLLATVAYLGLPVAIDMRVRGRRDKIVGHLPTVLDLLTLSIEAGMSFDAALQRLVRRLNGPLIDELELMLREIQLGTSRHDALLGLASRVDAPEMSSFVRSLTQADKLGVPLAQMLRTQADELRIRLRNEAEEHAMKAPVKMLFPTVALIFPAIFIVVLGPAVLAFTHNM
ncbi:MAG: type II secretion system F family protein [Gaiellales bacterium]